MGFSVFAGQMEKNYLIMKNEKSIIGLFQGMFPQNILTFNPGWDENSKLIENFDDIRAIQKSLLADGVHIENKVEETSTGAASFIIADPDGNLILIDQHV